MHAGKVGGAAGQPGRPGLRDYCTTGCPVRGLCAKLVVQVLLQRKSWYYDRNSIGTSHNHVVAANDTVLAKRISSTAAGESRQYGSPVVPTGRAGRPAWPALTRLSFCFYFVNKEKRKECMRARLAGRPARPGDRDYGTTVLRAVRCEECTRNW